LKAHAQQGGAADERNEKFEGKQSAQQLHSGCFESAKSAGLPFWQGLHEGGIGQWCRNHCFDPLRSKGCGGESGEAA
jgi:hypothetical protein